MGEGEGSRGLLTKLFARFALDQTHSKHTNILERSVAQGRKLCAALRKLFGKAEGKAQVRGGQRAQVESRQSSAGRAGGGGGAVALKGCTCHLPQSLSISQTSKGEEMSCEWKKGGANPLKQPPLSPLAMPYTCR